MLPISKPFYFRTGEFRNASRLRRVMYVKLKKDSLAICLTGTRKIDVSMGEGMIYLFEGYI